ncbi:MAG: GNAT family N-acetyltransferase [Planctomycetaceae bacterium]|nr:GNAT family N-acetyltransferase [Planctomycetaceae bacterium]
MSTTTPQISESPNATPPSPLVWRSYASGDVGDALTDWRHLEQRINDQSAACCSTWTDCWLHHYGKIVPHRILAAEADGRVRGMVLITEGVNQTFGRVPIQTRHIGTAGEPQPGSVCVEYNRLLVEEAWRVPFLHGIVEHLHRDSGWEQLRIDGFAESELEEWQANFPNADVRRRESRYFDFEKARQANSDVITQLGKSTRANLRRRIRQYGDIAVEWAESVAKADEILHELVQLHQARWNAVGELGAFASPYFSGFQRDAAIRLFLEDRAVLFRVMQGTQTVGCLYLLVDRGRLLDYLSGFVSFDVLPSPGLVCHYLCQEEALKRGYNAYDFLVGDKRHKENLSTDTNFLCWLEWSRPSWKMRSLQTMRTVKQRLREWRASSSSSESSNSKSEKSDS